MIVFGHEDVQEELVKTMRFAMENPTRFGSFISKLAYLESYGYAGDYENRENVRATCWVDRSVGEHGFVFNIDRKEPNMNEGGKIEWRRMIMIGLVYHKHTDTWGTHS